MQYKDLDKFIREKTDKELLYENDPLAFSNSYSEMKREFIDGKEVIQFKLNKLTDERILIRRDSRFTFVPFYRHTNINLNYIYSGTCTYIVNGTYITLNKGDICIFDKDVVRAKMTLKEDDIVFNISMSNQYFSDTLSKRLSDQSVLTSFILNSISESSDHDNYLIFRTNKSEKIISVFNSILFEYYQDILYSKQLIQSYLDILFMEVLRIYQNPNSGAIIHLSSSKSSNALEMLKFIEHNYRDCTIDLLCSHFGYHPKYISSLIKNETGLSFKDIQIMKRIRVAESLLLNTSYKIEDISYKVGFSNLSFFYKSFKQKNNVTPSQYRKQFI